MNIKGKIHSVETCGTVDGPGIRVVVFMQGCPLRCLYCHNPDTWKMADGKEVTIDELMKEIKKYKSYMKFSGGGVTVSGGEPLLQAEFVKKLFERCKEENIHTALDTSGYGELENIKDVFEYTDLVLLDIKSINPNIHLDLTGVSNEPTLKLAHYLSSIGKKVWIRYVLVSGITDNPHDIEKLAQFLSGLNNVEKVEILPFHKMGEYKWEELEYSYKLSNVEPPTKEEIKKATEIFKKYNLNVN